MNRTAVALLILAVAPACTGDRAGDVENDLAVWTAEPTVRAGALDGPGALADVFRVAVGPSGEILAAQPTPPRISVFDADGRFLRTVGRSGPGPGEFRMLGGIGWAGDTLWAIDIGRVHLFDEGLEFVRTYRPGMPPPPAGAARLIPGPPMADGSILGIPMVFGAADSLPILLVDPDGQPRTLGWVDGPQGSARLDVGARSPVPFRTPWPAQPLWVPAEDGRSVVVVERPATDPEQATFRIVRLGLAGDTLVDAQVPYAPVPVADTLRDRLFGEAAERIAARGSITASAVEEMLHDDVPVPAFHPPVTTLVAGRDGTIWVERERVHPDSADWQVFSAEGEPLARVRLPRELVVNVAERDRIWGVVKDSMDVSYVQVYRVTPPSGAAR